MSFALLHTQPTFNPATRWILRVLSWLAFGVAAYLAWFAINQTPVAGCDVGSHKGCDAVLNSPWSKWLGLPVAVLGLACYASLAGLSVLLGIRSSASRWVTTAFLMFAFLGAAASLWFIGLQLFMIGELCPFCMVIDICGIAIGSIALWAVIRSRSGQQKPQLSSSSSSSLSSLRSAIPGARATRGNSSPSPSTAAAPAAPRATVAQGSRAVPLVKSATKSSAYRAVEPPLLPVAIGGSLALFVVLVGGQILLPAKTFDVQQVALTDSIELSGTDGDQGDSATGDSTQTHVALRLPADNEADSDDVSADDPAGVTEPADSEKDESEKTPATAEESDSPKTAAEPVSTKPKRERKVKFLGGKLTLDTYSQPIIGSPEAPHVVVEMVSYDCPHCRKTNRFMKQALSRYGDQVALIVLVVPLDRTCNRLVTDPAASHAGACSTAKLALGISKLKPTNFPRFHEFLMTGKDKPPALESVIAKAYTMADRAKLKEARDSEEVSKQIASYIDLFASLSKQNAGNKKFGLPIQILGDQIMSGGVEKADDVYKAWEENLGVKPR